jgi:hypothetical protein
MSEEKAWVIENPDSLACDPEYLTAAGYKEVTNANGGMRFRWSKGHTFALRFSRKEDAELVAAICRTFQPDLWQKPIQMLPPARVAEHIWGRPA